MECESRGHKMVEASKDEVINVESNRHKMNTPPTSSIEIISPASSSKRGRLRAASLAGSPSAGRALGNPPVGFGAGLQNVPPPITTAITLRQVPKLMFTEADNIREPLPVTPLPGITETLKDLAPSQSDSPSMTLLGRSAPLGEDVLASPHPKLGLSGEASQENGQFKEHRTPLLNIYVRRADQIGPSHRIPGIGHLGDLLPPPGWKQGDDPINEAEAQKIFAVSRSQARNKLDQSIGETSQLSNADQEKLHAEKNAQYQTQRILDEYLLLERVKLHKFWHDRKQKQSQQQKSQPQQHRRVELEPSTRLQPLQPPAETSMIAYQRHQQSLVPASPHLYAPSPPISGGALNARINVMMQGLYLPQSSPISPTFLDPGLVPQTLEAVHTSYSRNQVIIMNMNNENERFLTQWSAKFQIPRSQGPVAPGVIPFITGQRAAPFGSVHYGYIQQNPRPWTPSQARFGGNSEPATQNQQEIQAPSISNRSILAQGDGKARSVPANRNGPFRYPGQTAHTPEPGAQGNPIPESKKRNRTPRTNKKKTWYDDEIAEANLPTSVISKAAMKAGMNFKNNGDQKQTPPKPTPPKPRGRRGMPVMDLKKGIPVSADVAKALIANGAADVRPKQPAVVPNSSTTNSAAGIAPSTGVGAGYQASSNPSTQTTASSVPTLLQDGDTISAPNSAVSGPSSDTPDDPKDTSYGQRTVRKPVTTNATTVPRKDASTASKKRQSSEAAPPTKKRTRLSVDRAADDE